MTLSFDRPRPSQGLLRPACRRRPARAAGCPDPLPLIASNSPQPLPGMSVFVGVQRHLARTRRLVMRGCECVRGNCHERGSVCAKPVAAGSACSGQGRPEAAAPGDTGRRRGPDRRGRQYSGDCTSRLSLARKLRYARRLRPARRVGPARGRFQLRPGRVPACPGREAGRGCRDGCSQHRCAARRRRAGNPQAGPWSQVGQGWMLAAWKPDKPSGVQSPSGTAEQEPAPTTLFLVDPAGGRYRMATLPAQPANSPVPEDLVAWSGDGRRALLDNGLSSEVAILDLRTGTSTEFSLGAGAKPLGFTAPDGLAILGEAGANPARPRLERFSLTGAIQQAIRCRSRAAGITTEARRCIRPTALSWRSVPPQRWSS